jgi:glycogen debranching enzyme
MEYPSYSYPVDTLKTGSSLGNRFAFAQLDAETNLKGLWCSADNQFYAGEWNVEILSNGQPLKPAVTTFFPESQHTALHAENLTAEKQFFLPFLPDGKPNDFQVGVFHLHCTNSSDHDIELTIRHSLTFPALASELFTKKPPVEQTQKKVTVHPRGRHCEVVTEDHPNEARVFGSVFQFTTISHDNRSLQAEYTFTLRANEYLFAPFVLSFSPDGVESALHGFLDSHDDEELLERSIHHYKEILSRSFIFTPEPLINRGLQWAKVNMARVLHHYALGEGFTNDPPQDIVVIRDLAWFVLGADYLFPDSSRRLLELAERFAIHENGKLTEFIRANENPPEGGAYNAPEKHDYKLNINDDTPLYVYALYHHALLYADKDFLRHAYPLMKNACDWILSQMKDGLVWCTATGENVWGICSWRNIIDGYTLSGAVTEINAECYFALQCTAEIASHLSLTSDAKAYEKAASALKKEINMKLVSEKTGFYLLNIDLDGVHHHDITGDLIFPVLFGVADNEMRRRILSTLLDAEMWTPFGSRTVSRKEKNFDPAFSYQLVGGVWPNLMAWIAMCARHDSPEKLVEGMMNVYKLSETKRPIDYENIVPGEFPERLHGENYKSLGMAMSPWMPPTYLWTGIEGLLGIKTSLNGLEMDPTLPPNWKWIAVREVPLKNSKFSAVLIDGMLYATHAVQSHFPLTVCDPCETSSDVEEIFTVGFQTEKEILIFAAATSSAEGDVVYSFNGFKEKTHVRLRDGEGVMIHASLSVEAERKI